MTTTDPLKSFGTNLPTPQNQRAPGRTDQVVNNAGGYVFEMTPVAWLRRFLTMGTTGGTFYVGQNELTMEAGNKLLEFTKTDFLHKQMVDEIVEISLEGRAHKQNPTLFALAIACQIGSTEAKQYARQQITKVVRTGTHLFIFVGYLKQFGGWSRGLRKAVANWYVEKDADQLAYQLVKYRQREGYTHRDVLRLTHPKIEEPTKRAVIDWAVKGQTEENVVFLPPMIAGYEMAQTGPGAIPALLETHKLPWEALPDSAMNDAKVWDKMLDNGVPMTALLRQLPRLTNLGVISQMGGRTEEVIWQLLNADQIHKARIHPIQVLIALDTYRKGQGMRSTWTPVAKIVDALDEMFYRAFDNVEPTGLRRLDCLDVSGSMSTHKAGNTNLTAREVSAAMAMVSVKSEVSQMTVAFRGGLGGNSGGWSTYGTSDAARLEVLPISGRQRLDDVVRTVSGLSFGRTDCALPMIQALHNSWEIDTFVIYTDNETWCGNIQPFQALEQYRKSSGIDARLVVVALTPTHFTIADPRDPGMLDISGFDSAVPNMINDFAVGRI